MAFTFAKVVGSLLMVLVEYHIVITLGVILLGFGGAEATRSYVHGYIGLLVKIGFKLFLMSIVVTGGTTVIADIAGVLNTFVGGGSADGSLVQAMLYLNLFGFLFLAIAGAIPSVSDSIVGSTGSGAFQHSASGAFSTAKMAAGMTAGGVMAGVGLLKSPGAVADALNNTKEAAGKFGASYNEHKAGNDKKGMGEIRAGVNALGSTAWNAYRGTGQFSKDNQGSYKNNAGNFMSPGTTPNNTPVVQQDVDKQTAPSPEELRYKFKPKG